MKIDNFNFDLPETLVAKKLCNPRDGARMAVLNRKNNEIVDDYFYNIINYFEEGDLFVINNTKVFPCVLRGRKENGGLIEIKLGSRKDEYIWDCIVESARELKTGEKLFFGDNNEIIANVIERNSFDTGYLMKFDSETNIEEQIEKIGSYFFPIYLPQKIDNPEDYQTIYASEWGSMQPPVAGMHFTDELFKKAKDKNINVCNITLHIGRLDKLALQNGKMEIEEHKMYKEHYILDDDTAKLINKTKENGKRIVAIGTTAVRTLESIADEKGYVHGGEGWTDLYIYPGYKFKIIDALLSNLQPPMTTNLMLACAFGGREQVMNLYEHAVRDNYKFLEYGDCALYI
ncbi:tRNA preQ1(34) S-adenosylmethionine ribosyltransferase-isomerase QueA [Clostridium oryzae]|uniref:S-adenosylmethionine:tRNA ribosyltransferase-isomerase n=1 Tax=Clostridium oryzae TaxID=1450648 RepID=A0A1V4I5C4_9CLOT|nr:tRNA preQ1(34) S-adenosylmethionine ribosyltransferase-isomerase QueA [Clostridium oryzae]OPJ54777.1 S-adenosylmethionine:tRNA ribosyltransferase-isomerase [Clostridium oryzae]